MNILLVDDDEHVLNHLFVHLKESDFDFSNIYISTSLKGARKILELLPIDILVSDIEMPGGSGLDLIEWTKKHRPRILCLLLTSYADFNYAHRAMQLKTTEYLLKPVDFVALDKSLAATISTIGKEQDNHQNRLYRNYWLDLESDAKDLFWRKTLSADTTFSQGEYLAIGYEMEDYFLAVSLEISSLSVVAEKWGFSMFEYALKNVILEVLISPFFTVESILRVDGQWIIICQFSRHRANDISPIEECVGGLIKNCKLHMEVEMRAILGSVSTATEIPRDLLKAQQVLTENSDVAAPLLIYEDYHQPEKDSNFLFLEDWEKLLKEGNNELLRVSIGKHLSLEEERQGISPRYLITFRQMITQMVYRFLKKSSVEAYKLFANPVSEEFYRNASNSAQEMETYCALLLDKAASHTNIISKPDLIIDEILEYINEHFCEDISRDTISNSVYLSPDYISRLFKKSIGLSISQYVLEKRMALARNMIESSNLPIKAVSMHVGYTNFSYFAKLFREYTGHTPIEYRDQHQGARDNATLISDSK